MIDKRVAVSKAISIKVTSMRQNDLLSNLTSTFNLSTYLVPYFRVMRAKDFRDYAVHSSLSKYELSSFEDLRTLIMSSSKRSPVMMRAVMPI